MSDTDLGLMDASQLRSLFESHDASVSAVILALYTLFIVAYLLFNPGLDYYTWSGLFAQTWMRIFSLLAFISLAAHAWVGLWTVTTDYMKSTGARVGTQLVIILAIFVFLVWGILVLWGA